MIKYERTKYNYFEKGLFLYRKSINFVLRLGTIDGWTLARLDDVVDAERGLIAVGPSLFVNISLFSLRRFFHFRRNLSRWIRIRFISCLFLRSKMDNNNSSRLEKERNFEILEIQINNNRCTISSIHLIFPFIKFWNFWEFWKNFGFLVWI